MRRQQGHMIITPWALISTVLMQNRDGIPVKDLVREVEWLKRHGSNLGFYVDWPGRKSCLPLLSIPIVLIGHVEKVWIQFTKYHAKLKILFNLVKYKVQLSKYGGNFRKISCNSHIGLHTAKGEAVRYHNRYRRNDTVFYRYCYRYLELR